MNNDKFLEILSTPSPSGWEKAGQALWLDAAATVSDRVETDAYGNAWAILDGMDAAAPRVMLEAHADEIGFIVRQTGAKALIAPNSWRGFDYVERIAAAGDMPSLRQVTSDPVASLVS